MRIATFNNLMWVNGNLFDWFSFDVWSSIVSRLNFFCLKEWMIESSDSSSFVFKLVSSFFGLCFHLHLRLLALPSRLQLLFNLSHLNQRKWDSIIVMFVSPSQTNSFLFSFLWVSSLKEKSASDFKSWTPTSGSKCFGRSELLGWLWRGFEGGEEESFMLWAFGALGMAVERLWRRRRGELFFRRIALEKGEGESSKRNAWRKWRRSRRNRRREIPLLKVKLTSLETWLLSRLRDREKKVWKICSGDFRISGSLERWIFGAPDPWIWKSKFFARLPPLILPPFGDPSPDPPLRGSHFLTRSLDSVASVLFLSLL